MAKNKSIVWLGSETPHVNAVRRLPKITRAYFRAGRALLKKKPSSRALHRFRLETKRFRYTLELFRPCYGPGLDERLAKLREIQTHLGEINDCAATISLVGSSHKRFTAFLKRRMASKTHDLHHYWRETFDAAGQESWWMDYLLRFVKRKATR